MSESSSNPLAPDASPPLTSPRDLADLARAGYVILRQPLMQVTFEVHHVADQPGYLANYVTHPSPVTSDDTGHEDSARDTHLELISGEDTHELVGPPVPDPKSSTGFGETLTSGAYGLGLVVVAKAGVGIGSRREHKTSSRTQCEVIHHSGSRIFRGTARPNPSFLYESAWRHEGLICVAPSAKQVTYHHSRAVLEIIHRVAKLAHECEAPILSLQAPAQIPHSDTVRRNITLGREEELLPEAASLAVRFSIALQRPDAKTILTLSDDLQEYCSKRGFGMWLEDTRLGSRTGNWFEVCECREASTVRATDRHREGRPVEVCMPVTLVGPARDGSTYALTSFLSQHEGIGIAACSVTPLDDLIFMHLELSFSDRSSRQLFEADSVSLAEKRSSMLSSDALNEMLHTLGYDHIGDPKRTGLLTTDAGDYQCLIGPPRKATYGDTSRRMAIWFSWQTQGVEPDLGVPLAGLYAALEDVRLLDSSAEQRWRRGAPNIEYLVCRNMGNSVFRGKGKLSIEKDPALQNYPYDALESRPTNLCVAIEEAWRARIARVGRNGIRELTVGWRECWLGHWSLPL